MFTRTKKEAIEFGSKLTRLQNAIIDMERPQVPYGSSPGFYRAVYDGMTAAYEELTQSAKKHGYDKIPSVERDLKSVGKSLRDLEPLIPEEVAVSV